MNPKMFARRASSYWYKLWRRILFGLFHKRPLWGYAWSMQGYHSQKASANKLPGFAFHRNKKSLQNEEIPLTLLILQDKSCRNWHRTLCRLPGFTGPNPSTSLDKEKPLFNWLLHDTIIFTSDQEKAQVLANRPCLKKRKGRYAICAYPPRL